MAQVIRKVVLITLTEDGRVYPVLYQDNFTQNIMTEASSC